MRTLVSFITLIIAILAPLAADALTHRAQLDSVDITIYAPDWTWQRQNVNVLVVAQNNADSPRSFQFELIPPPDKKDHFSFNAPTSINLQIPPRQTIRGAITDIYANDSVPRQIYDFAFLIRGPNDKLAVTYPLRTVRGAAVTTAKSALYLPVIVALIWSALFAIILPRLAAPGAWRDPQPAAIQAGDAPHD